MCAEACLCVAPPSTPLPPCAAFVVSLSIAFNQTGGWDRGWLDILDFVGSVVYFTDIFLGFHAGVVARWDTRAVVVRGAAPPVPARGCMPRLRRAARLVACTGWPEQGRSWGMEAHPAHCAARCRRPPGGSLLRMARHIPGRSGRLTAGAGAGAAAPLQSMACGAYPSVSSLEQCADCWRHAVLHSQPGRLLVLFCMAGA